MSIVSGVLPNNAFFQCPSYGSFLVASLIVSIMSGICYSFGKTAGSEDIGKFLAGLCGLLVPLYAIWGVVQFFRGSPSCAYTDFPGQNGWNPFAATVKRRPEDL